VDNQHRKISGYRELSQVEIDLMNAIKAFGPKLQELCDRVRTHVNDQMCAAGLDGQEAEVARLVAASPNMWEAMGRTDLQRGLMQITHAVAQPTFF